MTARPPTTPPAMASAGLDLVSAGGGDGKAVLGAATGRVGRVGGEVGCKGRTRGGGGGDHGCGGGACGC